MLLAVNYFLLEKSMKKLKAGPVQVEHARAGKKEEEAERKESRSGGRARAMKGLRLHDWRKEKQHSQAMEWMAGQHEVTGL